MACCWLVAACNESGRLGDDREPESYATYRCQNPFSQTEECRGYFGEGWTIAATEEERRSAVALQREKQVAVLAFIAAALLLVLWLFSRKPGGAKDDGAVVQSG